MPRRPNEIQVPGRPMVDQRNRAIRDGDRRQPVELLYPTDRYVERRRSDQRTMFSSGNHKQDLNITRAGSILEGYPGASIPTIQFHVDTVMNGIIVRGPTSLLSSSVVLFRDCRFWDEVLLASGCKAIFTNCVFEKNGAVRNNGLAANVGIIGCYRTSGIAHVAVTVILELT